jgi:hypothetical protein
MGISIKRYRGEHNQRYVVRRIVGDERPHFTFSKTRDGLRLAELKDRELAAMQADLKRAKTASRETVL